jgi:hypothetical protein
VVLRWLLQGFGFYAELSGCVDKVYARVRGIGLLRRMFERSLHFLKICPSYALLCAARSPAHIGGSENVG